VAWIPEFDPHSLPAAVERLMPRVSVTSELAAPRPRVWSLLRDFGDLTAFLPEVVTLGIRGSGLGAVRTVSTKSGLFVERCEEHDEVRCRVGYTVDRAPDTFPYRNYHAVFEVREVTQECCEIEWRCDFDVDDEGSGAVQLESLYRDVFIANIRIALSAKSSGD
jgi:hypothetical protein